jgi:hypothetical protein
MATTKSMDITKSMAGKIKDQVRLMQESGSSLLDTQALEIGKTMVYAAGHPGCMRNAINFTGPND